MGRPRKYPRPEETQTTTETAQPDFIAPGGAHFTIIQLPIDLQPKPSAQRIVMLVNAQGQLKSYVTENAYIRVECFEVFEKLVRQAYAGSVARGGTSLYPQPTRLHWCHFTEEFCLTGKGPRVSPEKEFQEAMQVKSE